MQEECNTCEIEMSRIVNSLQGSKQKIGISCYLNQYKVDPTETPNKEFIYIDIDAVGNGTGIWRKDKTLTGKSAPSRARRYAHKDSVLISTVISIVLPEIPERAQLSVLYTFSLLTTLP